MSAKVQPIQRTVREGDQDFIDRVLMLVFTDEEAVVEERPGRDALWAFLELEEYAREWSDPQSAKMLIDTGAPAALKTALNVLATHREITVAIGSLIAAFPGAKVDAESYVAVITDNLPERLSKLVLRLAIKQLIREKRFIPAVSEILEAVEAAEKRICDLPRRVESCAAMTNTARHPAVHRKSRDFRGRPG